MSVRVDSLQIAIASTIAAIATAMAMASCAAPSAPPKPATPPAGSWTLHVCTGVSWAGCGSGGLYVYPSKDDCFQAQAAMHTGDQPVAESNLKRNTVTTCAPSMPGDL